MKREAKGKRPQFYENPAMDQMMSMILVLAGEVSVVLDELDSIKRVLDARNLDISGDIEALQLDEHALQEREARRQRLLERLFYLVRKEAAEASGSETAEAYLTTIDEIAVG